MDKKYNCYCGLYCEDNALLREKGMDAWTKLQDERRANGFMGFTYSLENEK